MCVYPDLHLAWLMSTQDGDPAPELPAPGDTDVERIVLSIAAGWVGLVAFLGLVLS
jgi:hypothetical protein